MSAVGEWFGYYQMLFSHIQREYGAQELARYLQHLADVAYDDIHPYYRAGGLPAIAARYCKNFEADGGQVRAEESGGVLTLDVMRCPAFFCKDQLDCDGFRVQADFCRHCTALNTKILENAGYRLDVAAGGGSCMWRVEKEALTHDL